MTWFAGNIRIIILAFSMCLIQLLTVHMKANAADQNQAVNLAGTWLGTLDVLGMKLRLEFDLKKGANGEWTGMLDSPDQSARGIPIDAISITDRQVKIELKRLGGEFRGSIAADGREIVGEWSQRGIKLPLTLKPGKRSETPTRPQDPKPPFPYRVEDVTYENEKHKVKFAGTLTSPESKGPHPAVLLISGSGPQNRDEEIFGHKPFAVLADSLSRRGIAVLRVDDRGVGGTSGEAATATTLDFVEDVLTGVNYLKSRREIDPKRIGLAGHSEGGIIAPIVANRSKDIAFLILLAGTGVTGEEILYRQGDLIAAAMGAPPESRQMNMKLQRKLFEIAKTEKNEKVAVEKIVSAMKQVEASLPEGQRPPAGASDAALDAQAKTVTSPWFRHFLAYDPRPALEQVRCPVLVVNGELDLQVDPKQNLPVIETALKQARNPDFTIREMPGLNHLFQTCKTGTPSEYQQIDETINPAVLDLISTWITQRFVKP